MEGDEAGAEVHYREALTLLENLGDTYWPGHLLQNLAHFRLHTGAWKEAAQFAGESLAIGERYDYPMVKNLATAAVSGVLAVREDWVGAAALVGAVKARLARLGVQFEPTDDADFEKVQSAIREALGDEQYRLEIEKAASRPWEEVLSTCRAVVRSATA
jgi:hypothetical protein